MTTSSHHIIVSEDEQLMIVNALAFFHQFFKYNGEGHRAETVSEWQDVADDSNIEQFDLCATKIATSE